MRLTKIICTLGPASNTEEKLLALAKEGMDIARINLSHGDDASHRKAIQMVKAINARHGLSIACMTDNRGSDIRTSDTDTPIEITPEQEVVFAFEDVQIEGKQLIRIGYAEFGKDAANAEAIVVDSGNIIFDLVKVIDDGAVIAKARNGGIISSRRHVNLPGAYVNLPALTEEDWQDIDMSIEENADFVALSFIRTAKEVEEVRAAIERKNGSLRIISKIETRHAVENIDAIIAASDAIMVARGDLGVEIPYERVPAVQDLIVGKCRDAGKPVIVATQMLESMIQNPMPTRAEVTDIAHAVTTSADCTMLSGETAAGAFPLKAVSSMAHVLMETEKNLSHLHEHVPFSSPINDRKALAEAAVHMAISLNSPAILVITQSGATAQIISNLRPGIPIIALTESADVQRSLQINYGVIPLTITYDDDPEITLQRALHAVEQTGLLEDSAAVVAVTDAKTINGTARTVQIRRMN